MAPQIEESENDLPTVHIPETAEVLPSTLPDEKEKNDGNDGRSDRAAHRLKIVNGVDGIDSEQPSPSGPGDSFQAPPGEKSKDVKKMDQQQPSGRTCTIRIKRFLEGGKFYEEDLVISEELDFSPSKRGRSPWDNYEPWPKRVRWVSPDRGAEYKPIRHNFPANILNLSPRSSTQPLVKPKSKWLGKYQSETVKRNLNGKF